MTLLQALGKKVKELRAAKGISQEDFAEKVGLNRSHMGAIERGEANVCLSTLQVVADGLGTTCAELVKE